MLRPHRPHRNQNEVIRLINFWPDIDLDEYINLKTRVETRMKIFVMTSTGDDNLITPEEIGDLEYRSAQLKAQALARGRGRH